jgi:hypothetical protein
VTPRCPGCGSETELLHIRTGSGATMVHEWHPSWCRPCLQAKVVAARTSDCVCDDAAHHHNALAVAS